jgi:hypothetical protein
LGFKPLPSFQFLLNRKAATDGGFMETMASSPGFQKRETKIRASQDRRSGDRRWSENPSLKKEPRRKKERRKKFRRK